MNRNSLMVRLLMGLAVLSTAMLLHAATQPKFSLIPTTPTTIILPVNGKATVQYNVTNNTKVTRTLTMVPITDITQTTTGTQVCANPFTLSHNQSCLLTLQLNGSQIPNRVIGGPEVCKTKGSGDNTPDPFLCSQPSEIDSLNITSTGTEEVVITVNPTVLQMYVSGPNGLLTVTNHSTTVTAKDIVLSLPDSWIGHVTEDASNCVSVAPGQSCVLSFTPGTTVFSTPQVNPIQGSNTTQTTATLSVQEANLTVDPPTLVINTGISHTGTLNVTNHSTITANGVAVTFPAAWNNEVTANANCTSILAGVTCPITLTVASPSVNQDPQLVTIQGSNTTAAQSTVSVTGATSGLSLEPDSLVLAAGERSGVSKTITVTNTGNNPVTSITTNFSHPAAVTVSSTCSTLTNFGDQCVFTFTPVPGGTSISPTTPTAFNITGTSGTAIVAPATILVLDYGSLYQGGYLFSIDPTATIGTVVSVVDNQPFPLGWSTLSGITGANSLYLGAANTIAMITAAHPPVNPVSAEVCVGYSSNASGGSCSGVELCYNDWYLPAICEMGPNSFGSNCDASVQNIATSLPSFIGCGSSFCLNNIYWSSTEYAQDPQFKAWEQSYSGVAGLSQFYTEKVNPLSVRCTRLLT